MRLNCSNKILSFSTFNSLTEAETFFKNQESPQKIFLSDTFGENNCVVKCMDSLSGVVEFCLGFSSETNAANLVLMVNFELDRWVVQVDDNLYFINPSQNQIVSKSEIHTPLIGLYSKNGKLLALEEAGLKVFDFDGKVLKEHTIDLTDTFELKDGTLSVCSMDGVEQKINLEI